MSQPLAAIPSLQDVNEGVIFPVGDIYSDEPPLESDLHREQIDLLIRLIKWLWRDREDFYATGNLTIYFSPNQKKSEDFRGPDFFVVLDTEKKDRKSWVVWQENGNYPNVIIELLSDSTAAIDKGLKKQIYQNTFRTPDYFWFDPVSLELKGFHLVDGQYQDLIPAESGWLWSQQLKLYLGVAAGKLRFFTPDGQLVMLPEEEANQQLQEANQQLEQANQQLQEERQRAEILIKRLRAAGIEPE
ncbi:MAG: Uma2 family endonuclease [Cyanomargarita calcarea GSE-NOS-MK-12-04C]|jgi:Uma2 family endonuclease|uniref:Uma2 family endonuclease n=1 Tax=Cyanomargarita calcarea GSE-NOS-MK-12-04C TaxID=2839659 RepID=A0A951QPS3_9CYAN|nr:Uma2 family endonuclease [Cyanomargarita calcarea GSE-NOS-MK-12-04C]